MVDFYNVSGLIGVVGGGFVFVGSLGFGKNLFRTKCVWPLSGE